MTTASPRPVPWRMLIGNVQTKYSKGGGIERYSHRQSWCPDGHRAVFVMQVDQIPTYDQYWRDPRFVSKKPVINGSLMMACGDTYTIEQQPTGNGSKLTPTTATETGPDIRTTSDTTPEELIESYCLDGSSTSGERAGPSEIARPNDNCTDQEYAPIFLRKRPSDAHGMA